MQTKLHIPVTRSSLVPRNHLLAQLTEGMGGRLTLVSAPAGYGKTTLIAHWSRKLTADTDWGLAWFSLDKNDNFPERFFEYFIAALQKVDNRLGQSALELLRSPQASKLDVVLTDLLNTLSKSNRRIILILDDYHLIDNPAIHEGIFFLLENAPAQLHLMLISRADPPFSLAQLRARNQLTEIRQADLRFGHPEAMTFLNQLMSLDLSEKDAAALEKRTEGWVAGLQMAALSLQGQKEVGDFIQSFTSSNRYIFDYLVEEVLARRPKGTSAFLQQTAFLDRLCAPLCDAVLGNPETSVSSQQIMEQLEKSNVFFVSLDDERRWYRYHHLFADLLRQKWRRENPGQEKLVHERASRWFEQAGYPEEAISHALQSTDLERAASLVAQFGENWFRNGELSKIVLWTEQLPTALLHKQPRLMLNYAWALLFSDRAEEVEEAVANLPVTTSEVSLHQLVLKGILAANQGQSAQAIALLEKATAHIRTLSINPSHQILHGMALSALAYGHTIQGAGFRAEEYFRVSVALNREVGNLFAAMKAIQGWAVLLIWQGRLHEAERIIREGLQIEQPLAKQIGLTSNRLLAFAPLKLLQSQIYYQWNRTAEAEVLLAGIGDLLAMSPPTDRCNWLTALAKLHLARGEVEAIPPILAQLQEMGRKANPPHLRKDLDTALSTIRCALFRRQPNQGLRAAIEQSLPAVANDPFTHAQVLIRLDRPHEAIPSLEKLTAQFEVEGFPGKWLTAAVLLCLAYQRAGKKHEALACLNRAVQMAEPPGYIRLFLDEGKPMQLLLKGLLKQKDAPDFTASLLKTFSGASSPTTPAPLSGLLSPRERDVLKLIARGLTNQKIASKLVIAPSTAKRHVANIYNKLGVNNRAEATARAYDMGIVDFVYND